MDDDLKVSKEYKKWFNRGYHLRSTMPEVFKGMTVPENEPKEITQAFNAGVKQFETDYGIDREKEAQKEKLREQYRQKKDHDRGMDR